jgi:lipopolysaccharide transport system ATP-binding protein
MSDIAIKVENLSKQYRLGVVGTGTLSHDLNRWWHRVRGKEDPYLKIGETNDRATKGVSEYVWALKDINFEVKQGEILGIIGKNGAGKSTLLKLLSRVTSPTTGEIKTRGRIASLLEVGTGFHEELTGRENIFLNGAILGMSKGEIKAKLDEIIAFSGTERYVDTPVKRYSSGMRVRLAFAVAAHLEPEILIVDEVLAVGDAEFQNKAIGKMQEVSKGEGRTVLFVSHNMASIRSLCTSVAHMNKGTIKNIGDTETIIKEYLQKDSATMAVDLDQRTDRTGSGKLRFNKIAVLDIDNQPINEVISGDEVQIRLGYQMKDSLIPEKVILAITFYSQYEEVVSLMISDEMGVKLSKLEKEGAIIFKIPRLTLRGGRYHVRIMATYMDTAESSFLDNMYNAYELNVLPGDFWNSGRINRSGSHMLMDGKIIV